jgi:hypothetical protein
MTHSMSSKRYAPRTLLLASMLSMGCAGVDDGPAKHGGEDAPMLHDDIVYAISAERDAQGLRFDFGVCGEPQAVRTISSLVITNAEGVVCDARNSPRKPITSWYYGSTAQGFEIRSGCQPLVQGTYVLCSSGGGLACRPFTIDAHGKVAMEKPSCP